MTYKLMKHERRDEMQIGTAVREWVEEIAGCKVSDEDVAKFLKDYNDWIDSQEESLEISAEIYSGN
jgi:hypothetical protein